MSLSIGHAWLGLLLLILSTCRISAQEDSLIDINQQNNPGTIIVDGFVDAAACYANLEQADAVGNNDGKLQADEFVDFAQSQAPNGELDHIEDYQSLPLALQATFVTLTCMCRDERFGGDPRDVNCCLGVDAHIAIVGNDNFSTSQEATRLFATCFLTDQAISTVLGSEPPSKSPTGIPSATPTIAPTGQPTIAPSSAPTSTPSIPPTVAPTTPSPTGTGPTVSPTTGAPTTGTPTTAVPTSVAPTSATPTAVPTTEAPVPVVATPTQAVYSIAIENGAIESIDSSVYEPDLISAMDALATTVFAQVFATSKRRRHLQVALQLPTSISKYEATNCTESLVTPNDRCELVEHIVTLVDSQALGQSEVTDFENALMQAIVDGQLQDNLPEGSIVKVLTGMAIPVIPDITNASTAAPADEGLSSGATAGIVIAALAVTILPICFYLTMRNNGNNEKEPYGAYEPHDAGSADGIMPEDDDIEATIPITGKVIGSGTLGASPSDYGKSYEKVPPMQQVQKVPPLSPDRERDHTPHDGRSYGDSSSNAGSSGWSSSAGLSSLNTGSAEDSMDLLNSPQSSSLAAIGAASAVARRMENRRNISSPMGVGIEELDVPDGAISRNDLDNAIEAGDWAAVGATAALLAAASDSQSASSKSKEASRTSRSQATSVSSVDAARAAELDHLVDAGDWEGVVLAAAKFEAQEGSVRSGTASSVRSSSVGSDTGTGSGTFSPSVSTSVSESASKARKRDELRKEVEALVRRVVPEELDNVDEMMQQFKGREEELVETLRTMQERAVAQKARTAGHKAAKQEARRNVQRGGLQPAAPATAQSPPSAAAAAPPIQDFGSSREGQASSAGASGGTDQLQHRTALEQAIEAGDWEAVGEAAALMSDTSMASGSTAEIERLAANARLGSTATGGQSSRSLRIAGVNADRARALDEMIDSGNWAAVVEAAGRFNQADKEASSQSSLDYGAGKRASRPTESDTTDTANKRNKQLKEEEDALAQAEIWMQIAQQSKVEGATDAGARDAAEWAIARSLRSLKKAEEGDGSSAGGSHKGDSHQSGAGDDGSV